MRLIDEKGRVFGAINLFDLFVLCAIIFSAVFVYKWITVARDPSWLDFEKVHVKCKAYAMVPNYVADSVKEGDYMVNPDGDAIVRVDKILSKNPYPGPGPDYYISKNGDKVYLDTDVIRLYSENGETIYTRPPTSAEKRHGMTEVVFNLDILGYKKKGIISSCINNIPIRLGYSFNFDTKKYAATVNILDVMD